MEDQQGRAGSPLVLGERPSFPCGRDFQQSPPHSWRMRLQEIPRLRCLLHAALFLVMAGLLFFGRCGCPLLEPEEARYAEIPRQMLAEGRFLTPVLHGAPYFQKPPLLYWLVMASYKLFGVHDWSARLVSCTAAWLLLCLTFAWAWRRGGRAAGWASGLILCFSAAFVYRAPLLGMDSLLALWVLAALAAAQEALASGNLRLGWWFLSALASGLGILTKGPVALVLVLVPLAGLQVFDRPRYRLDGKCWLAYLGVAIGLAGPWYVVMALGDPEAASSFFWLHNVQRFVNPFDHAQPLWYYLPHLFLGMLPWSLFLVPLVRDLFRRKFPALGLYLWPLGWCVLFFSLSGCKRPGYILPALPLLALVLGTYVSEMLSLKRFAWLGGLRMELGVTAVALLTLFLAGVLYYAPVYHHQFSPREQVCRQRQLSDHEGIPVACYPRRWDSISFYLERQDVAVYTPADHAKMIAAFEARPTLLFVKAAFLKELCASMPASLEFVPLGPRGANIITGMVVDNRGFGEPRTIRVSPTHFPWTESPPHRANPG